MAFAKTARATITRPSTTLQAWNADVRGRTKVARTSAEIPSNLVEHAGEIFETPFDPANYLLTHATIVCSVDTFDVPNVKLGAAYEDGFKVNRTYADYRISPETDKYINNNHDAWSRPVIGKSHGTFNGAYNFVEHVQIVEQNKGRIIDAVARDIGESVYVDILIATDRKHKVLVSEIESGKMATLSMGCSVDFTICTKCGHVAADETELCPHIKYEKGSYFYDELGRRHRVAELCGHASVDPTGGVTFIEASWVETPAFTGAVLRNVLEPMGSKGELAQRLAQILESVPVQWDESRRRKAAYQIADQVYSGLFDDDDEGGDDEGEEAPEAPEPSPDALKDVEDKLYKKMVTRIRERVEKDIAGPQPTPQPATKNNDNLNKHATVLKGFVRSASCDADLVNKVARYHRAHGVILPMQVYRIALAVGGVDLNDPEQYMAWRRHARRIAGSELKSEHYRALLGLSRLLDRRASQVQHQGA